MADNVSYKYIHQSYSNKLKNKKNQIDILLYYLFYVFFFCKFQR